MAVFQDWELTLMKWTGIAVASFLTLNTALHPILSHFNGKIDSGENTIVLSNDYNPDNDDGFFSGGIVDFFMYPPVVLRQNLRGRHVDWYSNATRAQVLDSFEDPKNQNIVLIGHGSNANYATGDGAVGVRDLYDLDIPVRNGELMQHTCGVWDLNVSLRDYLYPDVSQGFSFDREVRWIENYAVSWVAVLGN